MRHPAKYSQSILSRFHHLVVDYEVSGRVLDPFAGTGRIHHLGEGLFNDLDTVGVELEPEWANLHPRTIVGNALALPFADESFDAVFTSPAYGNRMADHHEARDSSRRNTYRHALGRPLHPANTGALQWGDDYRWMHRKAWGEALRVLKAGALMVVNVSDHIRKHKVVKVVDWHAEALEQVGFQQVSREKVDTQRNGFGANGSVRVDGEEILVYRKAAA